MNERRRVLASNRRARHVYHILERETAGVELLGTEVKAVRAGKINLREGYVTFAGGEAYLVGCHIGTYDHAGYTSHDPLRRRRLLLHRRQIDRLASKVQEKGLALIPLSVYLKNSRAKVELGVGRGKRNYEKREAIKRQDAKREIQRTLRQRAKET